ncbi:MAG: TIGR02757 family protein [Bacteroidetes bacterium]|nr:MAG: TIGR02757 family protein [Bacteroidota bacterium]
MRSDIIEFLDQKVVEINTPNYILGDPISIPHSYQKLQDIEITAFWTAMLAWGKRSIIINKSRELFDLMDGAPHDFILNHEEKDRQRFENFKHRTFQYTDTLYFLEFLQNFYREQESLENAFSRFLKPDDEHVGPALTGFHELFFSLPVAPQRTRKHVSTPARNSACKRLNMFLRWMVRQDEVGVDFGLWKQISPAQLLIPLDVHVDRVARKLGLLQRKQTDWTALMELMQVLRSFDPEDPGKYDYALFGIGVLGELDELGF